MKFANNKELETYDSEYIPINYDIIRENHEIINENICANPVFQEQQVKD
jgi:hypothetical protein